MAIFTVKATLKACCILDQAFGIDFTAVVLNTILDS